MSLYYIDTSAAAKLLILEAESGALQAWSDRDDVDLVATDLLETELRRTAVAHGLPQTAVTAALDLIELYELPRSSFHEAGIHPGRLRSLDALHLIGALILDVDAVVTYDRRLREAAESAGIPTVAPS
jgi:uncharacterized protein